MFLNNFFYFQMWEKSTLLQSRAEVLKAFLTLLLLMQEASGPDSPEGGNEYLSAGFTPKLLRTRSSHVSWATFTLSVLPPEQIPEIVWRINSSCQENWVRLQTRESQEQLKLQETWRTAENLVKGRQIILWWRGTWWQQLHADQEDLDPSERWASLEIQESDYRDAARRQSSAATVISQLKAEWMDRLTDWLGNILIYQKMEENLKKDF